MSIVVQGKTDVAYKCLNSLALFASLVERQAQHNGTNHLRIKVECQNKPQIRVVNAVIEVACASPPDFKERKVESPALFSPVTFPGWNPTDREYFPFL